MSKRLISFLLAGIFGLGVIVPAVQAANEKRAHNIAIGTTAAAAYLLTHKGTRGIGLLAAGGAAYAWKKHHDAVKQRHRRESYRRASNGRYYYAPARSSSYRTSSYRTSRSIRSGNNPGRRYAYGHRHSRYARSRR
jgi:glutamine phosphoribosylpyrophosphate amidotransferase